MIENNISSQTVTMKWGLLAGTITILLLLSYIFLLNSLEQKVRNDEVQRLQVVLSSTHESLKLWISERMNIFQHLSTEPELLAMVEQHLKVPRNKSALLASKTLAHLRGFFNDHKKYFKSIGFFIISPDYLNIGSMRDTNIGDVNLISKHNKTLLDRAFSGEVVFVPPIKSDVPLLDQHGHIIAKASSMFFASPIMKEGKAIAIFTIRINPEEEFSQIMRIGRIGNTGETYAFDKQGVMLTTSRFEDDLKKIGLLAKDNKSVLSILLRDPGINLYEQNSDFIPDYNSRLTHMAQSATTGLSDLNSEGYRDYRGISVLGAWLWDKDLDIGITTEIDEEDALQHFYILRNTIILIIFVALLLLVGLLVSKEQYNKRINTVLRESNEDLEKRVQQRTADLTSMSEKALYAAKAKSEFLAKMSHEIRTPMNGITGMLQMMKHTELDKAQANHVAIAMQSAEHLLGIINDILDYSKIEAGKLELAPDQVDLRQIILELKQMFRLQAQQRHIELLFEIDDTTPKLVYYDPLRLRQILINLISNAIKFTEHGSVNVLIKPGETSPGQQTVYFEVSDTGIGIKTEQIEHLFDKFMQADNTTSRKYGGTGLGLAICNQLVQLMGGIIQVDSEIGKGTRFYFEIAYQTDENQGQCQRQENIDKKEINVKDIWPGTCVLLVEDNAVNLLVGQSLMKTIGLEVDIAENGEEALNKIISNNYEFIFMDCHMPVMDGYEATAKIREKEKEGKLRRNTIIALTANAMQEDRQKCIESGMDEFITKPFKCEEVVRIIVQWQSGKGSGQFKNSA